jgi:hypothetical protein
MMIFVQPVNECGSFSSSLAIFSLWPLPHGMALRRSHSFLLIRDERYNAQNGYINEEMGNSRDGVTALMMEAVSTSETLVNLYQTTRLNIPQDSQSSATL